MKTIRFKVTDDEDRFIRASARKEQVSLSEYLRRRATLPKPAARKPRLISCPHTDAKIFAGLDDRPQLTTQLVKEILSDFPSGSCWM